MSPRVSSDALIFQKRTYSAENLLDQLGLLVRAHSLEAEVRLSRVLRERRDARRGAKKPRIWGRHEERLLRSGNARRARRRRTRVSAL